MDIVDCPIDVMDSNADFELMAKKIGG